ncbi:hypothetical protein VNO77_25798 [Canavalia gladiata]|uniref:Uncharacterized protein n=1 Tax=Canavalia gladiata TaxID=3824 RepID=A0AAN9KUX2_CANGL
MDLSADGTSRSNSSERSAIVQLPEQQSYHPDHSFPSNSLTAKIRADDDSCSLRCGLRAQIPSVDQLDKPGGSWHQNRNNSSSFGFQSHRWSDVKAGPLHNGFSNRHKKPWTQVSYSVPFVGYDYDSRHKIHDPRPRRLPHKRIRKANEKKLLDATRGHEKNLEALSYYANLLTTLATPCTCRPSKDWSRKGAGPTNRGHLTE